MTDNIDDKSIFSGPFSNIQGDFTFKSENSVHNIIWFSNISNILQKIA